MVIRDTATPKSGETRRLVALALIVVVCVLSYVDRLVFSVFQKQIGEDLALTDLELGWISGTTFAIFYILAAFPIARYADRGDRPLVIALCVSVWSLATAACSLATSGLQMALVRIGLAAGEGGAGPAAQSLLLSLFPPHRRTIVLSSLLAASALGLGLGGVIAGQLSRLFEWRTVFVIVGLPGLLVAAAVWLFVHEPRRGPDRGVGGQAEVQAPLAGQLRAFAAMASLRWSILAIICISSTGFPFLIWSHDFYQTIHGMKPSESGLALFIPVTGGLVLGNLVAGWLADRVGATNPRFYGRVAAIGVAIAFPFGLGVALAPTALASLACFFVFHVFITLHLGPLQSLCFAQISASSRAVLGAVLNTVITLCGIGIGTFLLGAVSTYFKAEYGDMSLRYAYVTMAFPMLAGAVAAIMAARTARIEPA
ncbi:putative MFS family arabinose efflux permease [Novosphingobium kunmingense]|uniref:Putative MFS family arabinose efflux permease n=1 Tax=Novosphingobium kunmingense TaxID=1211806 RepID=A0A2N0H5Z5_9SPHN|nr:MFS transporter [Novosphingobium kunmingense]PKB14346.1 putative MFS family arabinose efflux permease [Novosphingobium kunmingense]